MPYLKMAALAVFSAMLVGCQVTTQGVSTSPELSAATTDRSNFVYVSSSTPSAEARVLGQLDRDGIEQRIARERSQDQFLRAKNSEQSVTYVLYGNIPVGARVVTSYTYSRAIDSIGSEPTDQPFTERFQYVVTDSTPIEPLLIVNELFSVFKGSFVLEAEVDGQQVIRSVVPVTNDLPGLRRN